MKRTLHKDIAWKTYIVHIGADEPIVVLSMDAQRYSLVTRIREQSHELSPTERRLAEVMLELTGKLANYSAFEVANIAKVSSATVTRLVRRLGYQSYDEARRQSRANDWACSPRPDLPGPSGEPSLVELFQRQSHANLTTSFSRLSESVVGDFAQAFLVSRKAKFVGFQSNRCFASYLRWQLVQVREYTSVIPEAGETLGEHLAGISHFDCLIIFALRRRVPQLARIVEHTAKVGARTLYITDHTFGADSLPVTWLVRCDTQAPGPLDNHVAVLAFCHLLAARVLELAGPAGRRRLTAIEAAHDALEEL
jgi:DNA-binding MurR/RpiR family transcriptional regulator